MEISDKRINITISSELLMLPVVKDMTCRLEASICLQAVVSHGKYDKKLLKNIVANTCTEAPLCLELEIEEGAPSQFEESLDYLCELREKNPFALKITPKSANSAETEKRIAEANKMFAAVAKYSGKKLSPLLDCKSSRPPRWPGLVQDESRLTPDHTPLFYRQALPGAALQYCVAGTNFIMLDGEGYATNAICASGVRSSVPVWKETPWRTASFIKIIECNSLGCACELNGWLPKFANLTEAQAFISDFRICQDRLLEDERRETTRKHACSALRRIVASLEPDNPAFRFAVDKDWYLEEYPDVKAAGMDAGEHYFKYGWKEGRRPAPWFETDLSGHNGADAQNHNPFAAFLTSDLEAVSTSVKGDNQMKSLR